MRELISLAILLVCMTSCNKGIEIIGHWRPADAVDPQQEEKTDLPKFRDMILNADSTFIVVGSDQESTKAGGWHNGDTQNGKWNFSKDILSLQIEGTSRPVKFKVLKLTKQEIIMEGEFLESIELRLIRVKN